LALLTGACGDDGGDDAGREDAAGTTTSASVDAAETTDTAATGQAQSLPRPGIGLLEADSTYLTAGLSAAADLHLPGGLEGDEGRLLLIIEAGEASLEEFRTEAEDLLASMVF
jgi:hypothetical protein